ncbi:MAG: sulfite exporter TauE/SafE family protein [Proteobacteria bacterium]|nr:sulfite exporter TauE/SafE family protein [Pseudomonadota bacterium]
MADSLTISIIAAVFTIAGTVKGVIGLGLPTVSLALLTVAFDLPSAMALLIVPSLVTNFWQAVVGGNFRVTLLRIWPFLLMASGTVWIGALSLTRINLHILSALLGGLLITYSALNLAGLHHFLKKQYEIPVGLIVGIVNGVLTGMTGSFVVPGVMFLQSINLKRDALIQAMGMLFLVSTLALAFSLQQNELLPSELGVLSFVALIPAIAGMVLGQKIRKRLSEAIFRRVFFISLFILGLYILFNNL